MKIKAIIKTNQKEQSITQEEDNWKISLKSEPINNKANLELIKLLEKYFGKKVIKIIGARAHKKVIEME
ncbi:MAG: DUF167 family protein [Candidatus Nanoarchaeia archaeon]|nr:DUF167 family protein [Candidatus Nanoarchaeia archaeon]